MNMIMDIIMIIIIIINKVTTTTVLLMYLAMPSNPTLLLIPVEAAMAPPTLLCNYDVTSMRGPHGVGVPPPPPETTWLVHQ